MARIIYKKGKEGQNRLECIEGIEIELLNGQKALIYPKYSEEVMLHMENIKYYGQEPDTEIEALKVTYIEDLTTDLLNIDSPAAEWVSQFVTEEGYHFNLPSLLAAMELQHQKNDIDELAETIEGADLLRDFTSLVWSCSRYNDYYGWIAYGYNGFANSDYLCSSYLAVPLVLYSF